MTPSNKLFFKDRKLDVVGLDFETYYDKDYSLRKLSTSEYVRDSRFEAQGVSIKKGTADAQWFTGKNIARALHEIDWKKTLMVGHHTQFDGLICCEHFGIVPAGYGDTLSMARGSYPANQPMGLDSIAKLCGLGGKTKFYALGDLCGVRKPSKDQLMHLGAYALDDINDTMSIFWQLLEYIPDDEMELIDITVRMFAHPLLKLNCALAQEEYDHEVQAKKDAVEDCGVAKSNLMSNPKFADELRALGVDVPHKVSPTTNQLTYAFAKTDPGFQELLLDDNPQVRKLARARLTVKSSINETRALRFLDSGKNGQSMPVYLSYSGAHTHRWTGGDKRNWQNLQRGGRLRRAIEAPKGYVIGVADSSQIEARITAWLAGQKDLLQVFRNNGDPYSEFASDIYNRKVDRKRLATNDKGEYIDKEGNVVPKDQGYYPDYLEGFVGKVSVLGLGFQMGAPRFRNTLAIGAMGPPVVLSESDAERIVNLYRRKNYKIAALWRRMEMIIKAMYAGQIGELKCITYGKNYIGLPNGLFLHYPKLSMEIVEYYGEEKLGNGSYEAKNGRSKIYGGLLTENVVQALARCVVAEQMRVISRKYRTVMTTHDEVAALIPTRKADSGLDFMLETMHAPPEWAPDLPIAAEGGYAKEYSK